MRVIKHNNIKYLMFWGSEFSNWYKTPTIINNISYNCIEQYMMHSKALLFGDISTAELIMKTSNQRDQKALGRTVKNYDDAIWSEKRFEIVKAGVKQKFLSNKTLFDLFIKHKDCYFVEASPLDKIWGIGYDTDNAIANIDYWGLNLLGQIYNDLRHDISFVV